MSSSTTRALLIGIDFYSKGTARKNAINQVVCYHNLGGCCNDVLAVESYLTGIGVTNITKLTASCNGSNDAPLEPAELLPTRGNIIDALIRIANDSAVGDLVYIHYSGHGTRRDALAAETSLKKGDVLAGTALVPTDVLKGGAYLTGYELGIHVRIMVQVKKLRVTVVLDSCYSGRAMRGGTARASSTHEVDDSMLPSDLSALDAADGIFAMYFSDGRRTAQVTRPCWMTSSEASGCAVLTACGIKETASEWPFADRLELPGAAANTTHGCFTYWMLRTLLPHANGVLSHRAVCSQVAATLHEGGQSPVLHGGGHYAFLSHHCHIKKPFCLVKGRFGDNVILDIGATQGVAREATYAILPMALHGEVLVDEQSALRAQVVRINDFSSVATLVGSQEAKAAMTLPSRGVLSSWALPHPVHVDLDCDRAKLRAAVKEKLDETPGILLIDRGIETTTANYIVSPSNDGYFEIVEGDRRLPRVPLISVDDEQAGRKLGALLQHISRFRAIERMPEDVPPEFAIQSSDITLRLRSKAENDIAQDAGTYQVNDSQEMSIQLTYNGPVTRLYMAIFSLNSSWGIERIYPQGSQCSIEIEQGAPEPPNTKPLYVAWQNPSTGTGNPSPITEKIRLFLAAIPEPSWDDISLPDLSIDGAEVDADPKMVIDCGPDVPNRKMVVVSNKDKELEARGVQERSWGIFDYQICIYPKA